MQIPLQITFQNMEPSEAVEARIREKAQKLDRFHDHIMACRVVVELVAQHQHHGKLFQIRIDITVPGNEIVVSRDSGLNHAHEDIYVAIRDAFNAARRQLEDRLRKTQRKVKSHDTPPHGRVIEYSPENGFGKIQTPDGREVYFHENSVLNGRFRQLDIGSEVRFVEEQGEMGPQASTVRPVGKHHITGP
ncbi:ribosomal subunit interface protein [Thiogranum longum]|uniref:Ribosomal subunit interface protein n=1 Tax=Thiogranum longum TaxID=1537524 RepID=A0A4V2PGY5_9GAMM|nr:ribosome-associated translation inhibitor RaiA [Thiogranum longum]TCK18636.1 ribosomal subunit interface protein [Thiogranum longum]